MRLEQVKRDLANPTLSNFPITHIVHNCGFSSSAHFSRSFKETFGVCPSDYRHQHLTSELIAPDLNRSSLLPSEPIYSSDYQESFRNLSTFTFRLRDGNPLLLMPITVQTV